MRNERLRALLLERGKTPDQLAEAVRVDAKTVERWITRGRLPYRRHRFEVATFLGVDEGYIWPDALGKGPAASRRGARRAVRFGGSRVPSLVAVRWISRCGCGSGTTSRDGLRHFLA